MSKDKDTVVLQDVKKSLTLGQFETLQQLALEDYEQLARGFAAKEKFEAKSESQIESAGEMPPQLARKIIDGVIRKADKEFFELFKDNIDRHEDVLDFLNTFRTKDNQLDKLI